MAEYGRLEVFSGGGWGSVCDRPLRQDGSGFVDVFDARFTENAANVACRQLGFMSGAKTVLSVRAATAGPAPCMPLYMCHALMWAPTWGLATALSHC